MNPISIITLLILLPITYTRADDATVIDWIRERAVPTNSADLGVIERRFSEARIVALGEATHGQHESFELKRKLTMHLIRKHGYRVVAYEASSTSALAAEQFVQGNSADLVKAIEGLGMLIWRIEENAALLEELRAWNASVKLEERVHFVGVDVQDVAATSARLVDLLRPIDPSLADRAARVTAGLDAAVQKLWSGDRKDYEEVESRVNEVVTSVSEHALGQNLAGFEIRLRARELQLGVQMFRSPGGRDHAMAEMLLAQLESYGADAKCVFHAHNAHVMRSKLTYLQTDELAAGGHLAASLGERYYAVGFAFGPGEFQALDRDQAGQWGFRRYQLPSAPVGSLEAPFQAALQQDSLLDLRSLPQDGAVRTWFETGHGQRWFGGYNVAPNVGEIARDLNQLLATTPSADFDAIAFHVRTTTATPMKPARIIIPVPATKPN